MNTVHKLFHDAPEQALINYLESDPTKIVIQKLKFEIDAYKLVQYNVSLEHDATALNYYEMEGISAQSRCTKYTNTLKTRSGAAIYDQELNDIIGVVTWNILQSFQRLIISMYILWFKALHIFFMLAWMSGLFYLPRLFVYHATTKSQVVKTNLRSWSAACGSLLLHSPC